MDGLDFSLYRGTRTTSSAVNLKFLSFVRKASCRNFKFKTRTRIIKLLVPLLIPKFASEVPRVPANFGIGALVAKSGIGLRKPSAGALGGDWPSVSSSSPIGDDPTRGRG